MFTGLITDVGEVSSVDDESRGATGSAWISLLGPLVNFALAGVFFAFVAWPALSTSLTTMFRYVVPQRALQNRTPMGSSKPHTSG